MSGLQIDLRDGVEPGVHLDGDWWPDPLPANVRVGERCYLYSSFAFQRYRSQQPIGVRIGHDTGVYEGTTFDLGPSGEVEIGIYGTVVSPIFFVNGHVRIGDYAMISHDVTIADDAIAVPPDAVAATGRDPDAVTPSITLGNDVWVGTKAVLLAGAHLGDGAIIGAGTVVDFQVPPYAVVVGSPARVVGYAYPGEQRPRVVELPEVHEQRLARARRAHATRT